jgi:hypothetical protein
MRYDAKMSFRARRHHLESADRIAENMLRLPEYELVGPTGRSVLRMALQRGAGVFNDAQEKYFTIEEARNLSREIQAGATASVGGFTVRLPYINSMNVHLTPGIYADDLFAKGVVAIIEGRGDDDSKDQLVHVRMPQKLLSEIKQAIARLPRAPRPFDTSNAAVRLMLEIGLFLVDDEVYWRRKEVEDPELDAEMRGVRPRRKVERLRVGAPRAAR